ncbi:MAG: diphthamide synthase subunit DPH2 [archaeon GW2011_AR13]|nr:MAG: diphthamide synthase subunit DPH2 [archaeon GW2011_AR13]HIG94866.1 hypothetical protein [Nanoarchaeota archaeon]HIH63634.1 hypothetical protein [Nanoarchaeota archaeon]HIJ10111.1 hypothetical protein [Nanoarchaeota archaeon]
MQKYTISDIEKQYDLELNKIIEQIKKSNAKLILLQFPDGLKQYATAIVDYLEEKTDAEFLIWIESCFGACDTPILPGKIQKQIDLTIQFGHSEMMPSF